MTSADEKLDVQLVHDDALQALKRIKSGSAKLIVTSPPYNIGKEYERDKKMSLEDYLAWLKPIVKQCHRVLADDGSICWQTGNYVDKGVVHPLDFYFYEMFIDLGMQLRNRIIWRFNFGLHATKRFSGRYETLLWFTKSNEYQFNLDPVRVPQLYPGKKHSSAKGEQRAGKPSGNPKGKNPSDYWEFSASNAFLDDPVWDIPNVKSNHPEKTIHPCQFPHELAERCILAFTKPEDLVIDPFLGAGTTAIASVKAGRRVIGIDKDERYIGVAVERVAAVKRGELNLRPSGRAVRAPKANESVAQVPSEWGEDVNGEA
ncbi:site-specific DNA-methyltransferase (adenine-specific)/adenine-specific DNA-methyltransferase [Novosphingobium sp. PhB165]|uniref:DNA-methyltransferase n=1 Tax=Novosphingobium sp. PhB165 TaxID=2485105 RepID=UPI00104C54CC|nr:site-specific DNA-methyltransferase [Novosphingobium sp. PhB165]TCM12136.1 site-specific DNA-methyltransferase (adenine-specific)/adenine-specific DNA-methyltransferase [Novosphingobium sp. PhB165]